MASGWPTRKGDLTPDELAACDAVKKLRAELGMSQRVFGRQVGVDERTVGRWERKKFCPAPKYLVRLEQLERLNQTLDEDQKREMEWVGTEDRRPSQSASFELTGIARKRTVQAALGALILRATPAKLVLDRSEVEALVGRHVEVRVYPREHTIRCVVTARIPPWTERHREKWRKAMAEGRARRTEVGLAVRAGMRAAKARREATRVATQTQLDTWL